MGGRIQFGTTDRVQAKRKQPPLFTRPHTYRDAHPLKPVYEPLALSDSSPSCQEWTQCQTRLCVVFGAQDNDGSTTSNSTDEKLSTRSSGQPSTSGSDSSSSSSSDESDGATTRGSRRRVRQHRDGTHVSVHASQAELNIAAQLAKDPWGRWGGKASY